MFRSLFAAAILFAAGAAFADARADAIGGVTADAATTAVALSVPGAIEVNPLGFATVPIRLALIEQAKHMPAQDGIVVIHSVSAASWGAAAGNLLVFVGAGPAALPVGLGVMLAVWTRGEEERAFYHECAIHELLAGHAMTCTYTPSSR